MKKMIFCCLVFILSLSLIAGDNQTKSTQNSTRLITINPVKFNSFHTLALSSGFALGSFSLLPLLQRRINNAEKVQSVIQHLILPTGSILTISSIIETNKVEKVINGNISRYNRAKTILSESPNDPKNNAVIHSALSEKSNVESSFLLSCLIGPSNIRTMHRANVLIETGYKQLQNQITE